LLFDCILAQRLVYVHTDSHITGLFVRLSVDLFTSAFVLNTNILIVSLQLCCEVNFSWSHYAGHLRTSLCCHK